MKFVLPGSISGSIRAPSSKSIAQRGILAATLSAETSQLSNVTMCDDIRSALRVAEALGALVIEYDSQIQITGKQLSQKTSVSCGESALCLRLTSAIAALTPTEITLHAEGSLQRRPVDMVVETLNKLGAEATSQLGFPPLSIKGPLRAGEVTIDGTTTSQFLSGLLMALPLCTGDSRILAPGLASKPYVALSIEVLRNFGIEIQADPSLESFTIRGGQSYHGCSLAVEGDWSAGASLLVAAAIAGKLELTGLNTKSAQADRAIVSALAQAGADVSCTNYSVQVRKRRLRSFEFDATHCPDLFPPLVALACYAEGISHIHGADRLLTKESNRAAALTEEFSNLGATISCSQNVITVTGSSLRGGEVDSHNDHRIAMACAIAGLGSRAGVMISHWEAVQKSYPLFFETLESVREHT